MKLPFQSALLFGALAVFCAISQAATFYVRTDGNNANPGTSNSAAGAWKSVLHAADRAQPGDTVLVADGVYNEGEIYLRGKAGSNSNRVILKSINKWGAKINPTSEYWGFHIKDSTGVTIEGFDITYPANSTNGYGPIYSENSDWVTIKNNLCVNGGLSGIQLNHSDNLLVEGNICRGNSKRGSGNGSGISILSALGKGATPDGGFGVIVRNNIAYENECRVFDGQGRITDGNGIIIDFFNGPQTGQPDGYPKNTLVENNLSFNNGGRGIHLFNSNFVTVRNNTTWHNNYVLGPEGIFSYIGDLTVYGKGHKIYNNIVVQRPNNTKGYALFDDSSERPLYKNNIIVGDNLLLADPNALQNNGSSGNITSLQDDFPKFVKPTTASDFNFRLKNISPAINAGDNSNAAATDLDGKTRPINGTVDIGAFESSDLPVAQPQENGLLARYFGDPNLTTLIKEQIDPKVDFDWAMNGPNNLDGTRMNGVGPFQFSVRWEGQVQAVEAGTYTFTTRSDDGVRLWIGDLGAAPLIDQWVPQAPTYVNKTITLAAGQKYNLKLEYFQGYSGALAQLFWTRPGGAQQIIPSSQLFTPATATTGDGLRARYYNGENFGTLVNTRVDPTLNFLWNGASPLNSVGGNQFSVRWEGQIQSIESGQYTFTTRTDDGVRLWVGTTTGTPLINQWVGQAPTYHNANITLAANTKYAIKMEYFQAFGGSVAQLLWTRPGQSSVIIPQAQLYSS